VLLLVTYSRRSVDKKNIIRHSLCVALIVVQYKYGIHELSEGLMSFSSAGKSVTNRIQVVSLSTVFTRFYQTPFSTLENETSGSKDTMYAFIFMPFF
jgi:hypothetical protein